MAMIFLDGCDLYGSDADIALKWTNASSVTFRSTDGRFGGGSIEQNFSFDDLHQDFTGVATIVCGCAFKITGSVESQTTFPIFEFREGSTIHAMVGMTYGRATCWRSSIGNELARSTDFVFQDSEWHYMEAKITIDNTVGAVVVHVDGVEVLSATGLDTQNGGTAICNRIEFSAPNLVTQFDDFYILDTTGSAPWNDFLGDVMVDTLVPDGDGNYTEYGTTFPVSPVTHWDKVEELQPDDDTSYNEATATNQRDTFTMGNLAAITSQTIYAVQQSSFGRYDSSATNFRHKLRISATDYDQSSQAHSSSYAYDLTLHEQDPNAGPGVWTEAVINATESGYEEL